MLPCNYKLCIQEKRRKLVGVGLAPTRILRHRERYCETEVAGRRGRRPLRLIIISILQNHYIHSFPVTTYAILLTFFAFFDIIINENP